MSLKEVFNSSYAWLGRKFLKITLTDLDDDAEINIQEIRQLIDGDELADQTDNIPPPTKDAA